jgi:hypothetical protein
MDKLCLRKGTPAKAWGVLEQRFQGHLVHLHKSDDLLLCWRPTPRQTPKSLPVLFFVFAPCATNNYTSPSETGQNLSPGGIGIRHLCNHKPYNGMEYCFDRPQLHYFE